MAEYSPALANAVLRLVDGVVTVFLLAVGAFVQEFRGGGVLVLVVLRHRHGVLVGTGLAMWRLLRCNPLSRGGLDFVPEHIFRHKADVPPALILPGQRN